MVNSPKPTSDVGPERAPQHTCDYHRDRFGRCAMCLTDQAERLFDELEAKRTGYHRNSGMGRYMNKLVERAHQRVLRRIRLQGIAGPSDSVRCKNCGGAHHIQRCPEIWQALRAPALPATARQWLTEDWRRDAIAREWSQKLLAAADACSESYAGMEKARS